MSFPREELEPLDTGVPDDTMYLGDRLDQMTALLQELVNATTREENPAPELIQVMSGSTGVAAATAFARRSTSVRHRVSFLVINGGDAATTVMTLVVGVTRYPFTVSTRLASIPFPITIENGVDIAAENSAGSTITTGFYIFSFPE